MIPQRPSGCATPRLVALLSGVGYREMRLIDETFLDDYLADALEEQDSFKGRVDAVLNEGLSGEDGEIPGLDILDTDDAATKPGERSAAPLLTLLAETAGQENITLVVPSEGDVRIPRSRFVADL